MFVVQQVRAADQRGVDQHHVGAGGNHALVEMIGAHLGLQHLQADLPVEQGLQPRDDHLRWFHYQ